MADEYEISASETRFFDAINEHAARILAMRAAKTTEPTEQPEPVALVQKPRRAMVKAKRKEMAA